MATSPLTRPAAAWPELRSLAGWTDTCTSIQLWCQMLGKTRLALAAPENHWWHSALHLTARGLTTRPTPCGARTFEAEMDLVEHRLVVRASDGGSRVLPLTPQPVAEFYRAYRAMLRDLDLEVRIWPRPVEFADPIPFPEDETHAAYSPEAANRCWQAIQRSARVLQRFRGGFYGKCSPVHLWWGSFDLACTRFSGRGAPRHPGGIPNLSDRVTREAYSHECISLGWWPGGAGVPEASYYAYVYPEPPGCVDAPVAPAGARYDSTMHEWFLPYEAVRTAPDPEAALLEFARTTYEAGATLGRWDRAALEQPRPA